MTTRVVSPSARASGDPAQKVQILQRFARADDNDAERILGQEDGEAGLLAQ